MQNKNEKIKLIYNKIENNVFIYLIKYLNLIYFFIENQYLVKQIFLIFDKI